MRGTSCPSRSDLTYSLDIAKGRVAGEIGGQHRISLQRHGMYCSHDQYQGQLGKITHKLGLNVEREVVLRNGGFDEGSLTAL